MLESARCTAIDACQIARVVSATPEIARTPRTLPLVVARGYRAESRRTRQVAYRRAARCEPCKGAGCRACAHVGWLVVDETLEVAIPAGATAGARLRFRGMADAEATDLFVELVEAESERACVLERATEEHERSLASNLAEAQRARARERRARLVVSGAVAAGLVSIAALFFAFHLMKGKIGDSCTSSDECRSNRCATFSAALPVGVEQLGPGAGLRMCTEPCDSDADCPSDTTCASVTAPGGRLRPEGLRTRLCMPTK